MGYVYFFIAILIIGAFVEYPVISIAITIGLITLIVYITKSSESKGVENSQTEITNAVSIIEEGYKLALSAKRYEPFMLTMYVEEFSTGSKGFSIIIYTHTEAWARSAVEEFAEKHSSWNVKVSKENDIVYLERIYYGKIACSWNRFNSEVWNRIKSKHPTWKIDYIRNDKSVLRLD